MEHFHSDWTFKPITVLHVNAPSDSWVTALEEQSWTLEEVQVYTGIS